MLNDYSLISKPVLPANACRINAKSILPNQPLNFSYPTRVFNNRKRSFKASRYKKWRWLHYIEENDTVLCYVCMHANYYQMLLSNKNKEEVFITSGFSNWKNATELEDAVSRFLKIPSETNNLIQTIRSTLKLQQDQNRKTLIKIISSIRYLTRQGIALRGHNKENWNFIHYLIS